MQLELLDEIKSTGVVDDPEAIGVAGGALDLGKVGARAGGLLDGLLESIGPGLVVDLAEAPDVAGDGLNFSNASGHDGGIGTTGFDVVAGHAEGLGGGTRTGETDQYAEHGAGHHAARRLQI